MKIERTKNAARNVVWGIIEKVASLLLPFAVRTIMIKTLGSEYLGLSSLFTSILSVLSISELGIGTAIVFSMYKPIAEDDNETLCALLNAYRSVYRVIGIIILIAGLAITPFLPKLVKGSVPSDVSLYALYFIYLFNTVISYFLFSYKAALFSAFQRNDLLSKRSFVINLCSNIYKIAVLILFHSYYVYVIIIPVATIATNLLNAYLANKMFPDIQCKGVLPKETKDGIKKRIIGLMSFKIYNVVFASVDSIVISSFLGLTPLAIYNNYYYVQNSLVGFLVILTSSITAGVGNKMVTNSKEDNYSDFKKITFVNGWICSWCAVCMFCLYQPFMELWVGKELVFPFSTMTLMVFYFLLPRITTITYTYREAAGLWWEDRFRPLVSTVVNLVTNIVLVQIIGMNGVIISTLICTVFINIPWGSIILFKNYFCISPKEYFSHIIFYLLISSFVGGSTYFLCTLLPDHGFVFLLVKASICFVIPNILFWICYHRMKEYSYVIGLFNRFLTSVKYKIGKGI